MFPISLQLSALQLAVGLLLAALVAGVAWRLGLLARSGAIAACLLGGAVYALGGLPAAILLVAFFVSSSLLTRLFTRRKRVVAGTYSKGGQRDAAQVLANGGPALLVLLLSALLGWPARLAWPAFAAVLASVTADTWATELGVLSRSQPRLITTGRRVPKGSSGAVSAVGSLAAAAGAVFIAGLAGLLGAGGGRVIASIALAGWLGAFFDSLLGATWQAIYYCPNCKKETEQHPQHTCGTPTRLQRGWAWLNNDWVNLLSALCALLVLLATTHFWL